MARLKPVFLRSIALATLPLVGSCRAATLAYGPDLATARANADALVGALEQRFTNVVREPKFANARMRIARYALAPSKLVGDTALWTEMRSARRGAERDLIVLSAMRGANYTFSTTPGAGVPSRTGDSRHVLGLVQLNGENDWQWTTSVENAVGSMPPARADDIMRALFASAERPSALVRADYRAAMPRATAALGRLFSLDSISTSPQPDGSTLVALHVLITDAALRSTFPELAKFVKKYVAPARYRFRLADRAGGDWFDAQGSQSRLIIRFRSNGGTLQPLVGTARLMPDTLALHVDGFAKLGLFTVGVTNMVGEFVHVKTPIAREWAMRFTKEPEWHLPLIGERLLRAPLRRPFEGSGVQFRIGFTRGGEPQTLLSRTLVVAVRESAIMRFLGNLGFTAMSDFAGKAEEEENRFLAEAFRAMRADMAAMGTR